MPCLSGHGPRWLYQAGSEEQVLEARQLGTIFSSKNTPSPSRCIDQIYVYFSVYLIQVSEEQVIEARPLGTISSSKGPQTHQDVHRTNSFFE